MDEFSDSPSMKFDAPPTVVVVGAGILGLAHAWAAARAGCRVVVLERSPQAEGASVRNFGMVWPIGQPAGDRHRTALRSRELWLEFARASGTWVAECGSIHLARREDELAVLEEFATSAPANGYECRLLTPYEVAERSPAANGTGLLAGLWSPTELCVDPRAALRALPLWLSEECGVNVRFGVTVVAADERGVRTSTGEEIRADHVIVCSGSDFETLFPETFAGSGLRRCKLQMLRTIVQPNDWRLGPHLAGGLTLRHYANFADCPSLANLKRRVAEESPDLDRYGIHVMAAQNGAGEVVLGDSHEYDEAIEPFDKAVIDQLMLEELADLIRLPDWTIRERWHGVYAKNPDGPIYEGEPVPGVRIATGLGGAGMTMSFGLAERSAAAMLGRPMD